MVFAFSWPGFSERTVEGSDADSESNNVDNYFETNSEFYEALAIKLNPLFAKLCSSLKKIISDNQDN